MVSSKNRRFLEAPTRTLVLLALCALGGCTWIKLEDAGRRVRVVDDAKQVEGCTEKGVITASVRDRVAYIKREPAKVADEVEALARNQAAEMGADTVVASSALANGERSYRALRCK